MIFILSFWALIFAEKKHFEYILKKKQSYYSMSDIISFFNAKQCKIHTESTIVPDYYVYTDGACSNNGRSNAMAGIGIYFGNNDPRNVSKRIEGKQTNNTAELLAIIDTYEIIEQDIIEGKKVAIVSDS